MARVISRHPLKTNSAEPQSISMQRRAKVLYVAVGPKGQPELFTECEQDDTTRALDVQRTREFVVLKAGDSAPSGACYLGACSTHGMTWLVYEVPGVKPQGL